MSNTAPSDSRARVAVMGSGSWGTAFALVVCDAGNDVTLWARRPSRQQDQHRTSQPRLFSGLAACGRP
jgi:glycerol-3-phosphate dehydrogenase